MKTDIGLPILEPVSLLVQVSGSLVPMPTTAAMDLWTCPLGEHPVTRPLPQESPLFLPLPEAQNVTENPPANGMLRPEEECLAPKTAVSRLYCYLFHAGVISESTAMHHSVICCSVPLCHDHCVIRQGCTALSEIVWDPSHAPLGCVHLTPLSSAKYLK